MSLALDKIIEEVRALAPEDQKRLLDALNEEFRSPEQSERGRLAGSIRGKYANVLTGSDEFAARKAEDLALEDR